MKEKANRNKFTLLFVVLLVFLCAYAVSLLIPLFWAMINSLKSIEEFRLNITGLPKELAWENFSYVFENFYVIIATDHGREYVMMDMLYVYALLYSAGCALAGTIVPCITAYICVKFPCRFSNLLTTIVIVTMSITIVGSLPSEIQVAKAFGLYDHIWGVWVLKAHFLGMYFLVFSAAFRKLPKEFTEAAKVDGAGNFHIFVRIMLPLIKNTFFTIALILFINYWNDYYTPLVFLPSYPTISYGVYLMSKSTVSGMSYVPMRMAGAMLALLPILVVYALFHKRLVGNLSVGGVKG